MFPSDTYGRKRPAKVAGCGHGNRELLDDPSVWAGACLVRHEIDHLAASLQVNGCKWHGFICALVAIKRSL
jgi:hypothetical protein